MLACCAAGIGASLTPAAIAQDAGSPTERRILGYIEAHNSEALALLKRAVNLNSGTMNFAGVRAVGRLFRSQFDSLGFDTRWVDGAPFGRAGHLVAERAGDGPGILLIGHLDTVFEPASPFQHFERLSDTTARGPGVTDMKGGDVIIIQAMKALAAAGALDGMRLTVIMTGDEEKAGAPLKLARKALLDAAQGMEAAIAFEDGDGNPGTAVISRRGSTSWSLRTTGTRAHSSQIFRADIGAGAIYEAARILTGFYDELRDDPYLTFNPGVLLGGTDVDLDAEAARGTAFGKDNVIAENAVASGDLRALSVEARERAKARMLAIVAEHLPHTSAELTFHDSYPPMAPSEGNRRLLKRYDQVSRDLGLGPVTAVDPRAAGAADVSFISGLVPMAIDGVGLMGSGGHTVHETADLRTLPTQTQRAALLLYRLAEESE